MKKMILLGNTLLIVLVFLSGFLYPAIAHWTYWAATIVVIHLGVELTLSSMLISDPARISIMSMLFMDNLISSCILYPYVMGYGEVWLLLAVAVMGASAISTMALVHASKKHGLTNNKH